MNSDTLDQEREFYFGKLQDIEEMLKRREWRGEAGSERLERRVAGGGCLGV